MSELTESRAGVASGFGEMREDGVHDAQRGLTARRGTFPSAGRRREAGCRAFRARWRGIGGPPGRAASSPGVPRHRATIEEAQATWTLTLCQPVAPSGITPTRSAVWV
ncbi:hypothetical protein GCM10023075_01380 [Streptosporangium album]